MKLFLDHQVNRRSVMKGAVVAGALTLGGRTAFAQSSGKSILVEPFDLILEFLPELNASAGGHFKANGLDIDVVNVRGTSLAVQQLIAGQASFTKLGVLDLIKAYAAQQLPLISVATIQQSAIFNIVSLKSAPILSPTDMVGKVVGVASLGGGTENNLDLMLATAGIPKEQVQRQAVGLSPGNIELLRQGRLAAFSTTVEGAVALQRSKEEVEIWNINRFVPIPGGAYVVSKEFADRQPKAVTNFVRALRASVSELLTADPNSILDRVEAKFELIGDKSREFRLDAVAAYNVLIVGKGKENVLVNIPDVWQASAELIQKAQVATVSDIKNIYTNKFVEAAAK